MDKMSRTTKKLEKEKRELKSKADATDVRPSHGLMIGVGLPQRPDQQPHITHRLCVDTAMTDLTHLVVVGPLAMRRLCVCVQATLIDLANEKMKMQEAQDKLSRKNSQLESLCRTLQGQVAEARKPAAAEEEAVAAPAASVSQE